jgi:chemotaxis methyl-accepting protein methylase
MPVQDESSTSHADDADGYDYTELQSLLEKIYSERGFDFREYKTTTLTRRLTRRLHARRVQTYVDYARVLDQDPGEYETLFNDLTINVTSFFRDDVAFRVLKDTLLPQLIKRNVQRSLYIWSAGCATGEEPYSIAMLLFELLGKDISDWHITLLATDIDRSALHSAQAGLFSQKGVEGIPQAWLEKYFIPENNGFRIQPAIQEMVRFDVHNLVSDPPCHDLDLVVCRNVLIYFNPELQTRVLQGFHAGLKEDGFLLLGKAEVPVGETKRLFHLLDSKAKVYRKASRSIADYGLMIAE